MTQFERLDPIIRAYETAFPHPKELGVIVDAGSRDGHDAEYLRRALKRPPHSVMCFEPREEAARQIAETYPMFDVLAVALGEHSERREMVTFEGDEDLRGSSSLRLQRGLLHPDEARYRTVRVRRLVDVLPAGPIDVLKIDVEGYALEVLRGLEHRIDSVLVAHIETETLERAAWGEPANNAAVAYFMRQNGFLLVDVSYEWGPSIEDQLWVRAEGSALTAVVSPEIAR